MWAWVPIFLLASYEGAGWSARNARLAGFGVLAAGTVGSVLAGQVSRTGSAGRASPSGASSHQEPAHSWPASSSISPGPLTALCLVWGFTVVADSAQFSAAVSELTDPRYVGTALTLQTSLGFLLTPSPSGSSRRWRPASAGSAPSGSSPWDPPSAPGACSACAASPRRCGWRRENGELALATRQNVSIV